MRKSAFLVALPGILGMLWVGAAVSSADDTTTSPAGTDWFRNPDPNAPVTVPGSAPTTVAPAADSALPPLPDHRIFASSSYDESGDYPSRDLRDWVFASAHAATARALFSRAETDLAAAFSRAQFRFERSKSYRDAVQAEQDAYDNYNNARHRALRELYDDPKYKELLHLSDDIGDKLEIRRASKDATKDEIVALATLKMEYASDARSMEVTVLSGDSNVDAARQRLITASQRVVQLRADYDDSLRDNPQILAARETLEDARIGLVTAQAYQDGATVVGQAALDYAYYLHRNDVGRYDYGGNGYGAYSPYWARD
jgi:hypothetical protein